VPVLSLCRYADCFTRQADYPISFAKLGNVLRFQIQHVEFIKRTDKHADSPAHFNSLCLPVSPAKGIAVEVRAMLAEPFLSYLCPVYSPPIVFTARQHIA